MITLKLHKLKGCASVTPWVLAEGRKLLDSKLKVREFEKSKEKGGQEDTLFRDNL